MQRGQRHPGSIAVRVLRLKPGNSGESFKTDAQHVDVFVREVSNGSMGREVARASCFALEAVEVCENGAQLCATSSTMRPEPPLQLLDNIALRQLWAARDERPLREGPEEYDLGDDDSCFGADCEYDDNEAMEFPQVSSAMPVTDFYAESKELCLEPFAPVEADGRMEGDQQLPDQAVCVDELSGLCCDEYSQSVPTQCATCLGDRRGVMCGTDGGVLIEGHCHEPECAPDSSQTSSRGGVVRRPVARFPVREFLDVPLVCDFISSQGLTDDDVACMPPEVYAKLQIVAGWSLRHYLFTGDDHG